MAVIIVDGQSLAGAIGRLEVSSNAELTIGVDLPGQSNPELVFLPDFARVRLVRERDGFAATLLRGARHRLTKRHPRSCMRLLTLDVVALTREPHG